jgi:hypothetical protein
VRFTDNSFKHWRQRLARHGARLLALALAACSSSVPQREPASGAPSPAPSAGRESPSRIQVLSTARSLPAPTNARSWAEFHKQVGRRLVAANPDMTYLSTPPDVLLAIPVISVDLNADGSIRRIDVMRYPGQAPDTTDLAIAALRRAAPFGDVSRLPKPWKFNETFLFNDERKFKPRSLD